MGNNRKEHVYTDEHSSTFSTYDYSWEKINIDPRARNHLAPGDYVGVSLCFLVSTTDDDNKTQNYYPVENRTVKINYILGDYITGTVNDSNRGCTQLWCNKCLENVYGIDDHSFACPRHIYPDGTNACNYNLCTNCYEGPLKKTIKTNKKHPLFTAPWSFKKRHFLEDDDPRMPPKIEVKSDGTCIHCQQTLIKYVNVPYKNGTILTFKKTSVYEIHEKSTANAKKLVKKYAIK